MFRLFILIGLCLTSNIPFLTLETFENSETDSKELRFIYACAKNFDECDDTEFSKTKSDIEALGVKLYKIKSDQKELFDQLDMTNEALYFFEKDDIFFEYKGIEKAEEFIQWIKQKIDLKSFEILSKDDIDYLKSKSTAILLYFGPINESFQIFNNFEKEFKDHIQLAHSDNQEIWQLFNANIGSLVLLHNDQQYSYSGDINFEKVYKWIEDSLYDGIISLNQQTIMEIIDDSKNILALFYEKIDEQYLIKLEALKRFYKKMGNIMNLVQVDLQEEISQSIFEFLGFPKKQLPIFGIIKFSEEEGVQKFLLEDYFVNEDVLINFFEAVNNKKIEVFIKSQDIPNYQDEVIKELVGKNYNDFLENSQKDTVVMFYDSIKCDNCDLGSSIFSQISENFQEQFNFAKIDMRFNDIKETIENVPEFIMFRNSRKEQLKYDGELDVTTLTYFIQNFQNQQKLNQQVIDSIQKDDNYDYQYEQNQQKTDL